MLQYRDVCLWTREQYMGFRHMSRKGAGLGIFPGEPQQGRQSDRHAHAAHRTEGGATVKFLTSTFGPVPRDRSYPLAIYIRWQYIIRLD
jgi:hypothetical protein